MVSVPRQAHIADREAANVGLVSRCQPGALPRGQPHGLARVPGVPAGLQGRYPVRQALPSVVAGFNPSPQPG